MKVSFSCEPGELTALLDAFSDLVGAIRGGSVAHVDLIEEEDDDIAPAPIIIEPVQAQPVAPATVTPFRVVESEPTAEEKAKAEAEAAKLLHGRDLWLALIEMWRQNFGVDAAQPDRVGTLQRVIQMGGSDLNKYLATKAGVTDATRDVLCELLQRPLDKAIKKEARLLAENIAQVSSFHAPHLTEMLEYTREYHYIED